MSLFITFEGPDGGGKTTQIQLLAEALRSLGHSVLVTREPGGTPIGNAIRSILLDPAYTEMSPRTETLLYVSARAQIVDEVIRPTLAKGTIVLCDRFGDSTIAYQGYGHGQDIALLKEIIRYATGGIRPDLTIYLDIDVNAGLHRKQPDLWDRVETYDIAFHEAVRHGYQKLMDDDLRRWRKVDGSRSVDEVQADILRLVLARLDSEAHLPVENV